MQTQAMLTQTKQNPDHPRRSPLPQDRRTRRSGASRPWRTGLVLPVSMEIEDGAEDGPEHTSTPADEGAMDTLLDALEGRR